MSIFLRLVHVSDLHFGASLSPRLDYTGWIPGLEIHDPRVVMELSNAMRVERLHNPVPRHIIATGDLTTWGHPDAFQTALTYLRSRFFIGGPQSWLGFNDPHASVVPGNHDMWGGAFPGRALVTGIPSSTRDNFARFFSQPAPLASYLGPHKPFPYQLRLSGNPVAIYLYGIDSTEIDAAPHPRWRNFWADGYVTQQQLRDLQTLVHNEHNEPRIRIAALHHPLVYLHTTGTPRWTTLINLDSDVLPTLQNLGFSIALCGHQHQGFVRLNSMPNTTHAPIQVFSVGTSTQKVRLSDDERQRLRRPYSDLDPNDSNQQGLWRAAAQKCNEYRLYDFESDLQAPDQLIVTVYSYRFDPHQFTFVENPHALRLQMPISIP